MKKFARNLSVKWRLIGFVCFLLLLTIGAVLGGLAGMCSANRALSDVYLNQGLQVFLHFIIVTGIQLPRIKAPASCTA